MPRPRSHSPLILAGALATLLLTASCASGPRYGASRKHKKECDCPKWNALPRPAPGRDVRADLEDLSNDPTVTAHASRH